MNLSLVYDKHWKKLMIIPLILQLLFITVIISTKLSTGSFFYKDLSLKGGTSLTIYTSNDLELDELQEWAKQSLSIDSSVIKLTNSLTGQITGYEFRTSRELTTDEAKSILEPKFGFSLNIDNFSIGVQSADIASSFFNDSIIIVLISFILMTIVAFYYFRSLLPSLSIMLSTVADVIIVIGFHNLLSIPLSVASIGALLMLIAFSTDSDILLATNIIKRKEGDLITRMKRAFKTELTMSMAAILTFTIMFAISTVEVISSIALILMIGSISDLLDTWLLGAGLQRIYLERKAK